MSETIGPIVTDLESHKARHEFLHRMLDELVADWIVHTDGRPSRNTLLDLMKWSSAQTKNPDGQHGGE